MNNGMEEEGTKKRSKRVKEELRDVMKGGKVKE